MESMLEPRVAPRDAAEGATCGRCGAKASHRHRNSGNDADGYCAACAERLGWFYRGHADEFIRSVALAVREASGGLSQDEVRQAFESILDGRDPDNIVWDVLGPDDDRAPLRFWEPLDCEDRDVRSYDVPLTSDQARVLTEALRRELDRPRGDSVFGNNGNHAAILRMLGEHLIKYAEIAKCVQAGRLPVHMFYPASLVLDRFRETLDAEKDTEYFALCGDLFAVIGDPASEGGA